MTEFTIAVFSGIALGGTYALVALGIIIIFRATDTFNFAHGQFMLLGAYLVGRWQLGWGAPDLVVLVLALVVVGAVGWVTFRLLLRRIVGLPPFISVVATLGFASVADGALGLIFGTQQYRIDYTWLPDGYVTFLGARLGTEMLTVAAISLGLASLTAVVVAKTNLGARLRASGQDVLLASQSGINVNRVYAGAWAMGCALAGFAGIAYGTTNLVGHDIVSLGLVAFPAILLGGLDSISGALAGGVLCGLVQSFTASYVGGEWTDVTMYTLLLLVIMLKPSGLFGTQTIVRV